jgi:hypothetical protein
MTLSASRPGQPPITGAKLTFAAGGQFRCQTYRGAYAICISRRVVPSRFHMAFNPILRAQPGLLFLRRRSIGTDCMNPAATEPGQALPIETHPTKNGRRLKMTTLTAKPKSRAAARGLQTSARADAGRISRPEYQALLQAYLSVAALGIVALKSALWTSHFND